MADKGMLVKPSGEKFVVVVPAGQEKLLSTILEPPGPGKPPAAGAGSSEELFAAGLIRFTETDLLQVLDIYAEVAGRTILMQGRLAGGKISVRSQTALSRTETVWLLDALLSLAGVKMVPEGEKFMFAVPSSRTGELPKFNPQFASAKAGKAVPPGMVKFQMPTCHPCSKSMPHCLGGRRCQWDRCFPRPGFPFAVKPN